jgi:hypothetical protein
MQLGVYNTRSCLRWVQTEIALLTNIALAGTAYHVLYLITFCLPASQVSAFYTFISSFLSNMGLFCKVYIASNCISPRLA